MAVTPAGGRRIELERKSDGGVSRGKRLGIEEPVAFCRHQIAGKGAQAEDAGRQQEFGYPPFLPVPASRIGSSSRVFDLDELSDLDPFRADGQDHAEVGDFQISLMAARFKNFENDLFLRTGLQTRGGIGNPAIERDEQEHQVPGQEGAGEGDSALVVGALAQYLLRRTLVDQKGDFDAAEGFSGFAVNDVGLDGIAGDRSERQCKFEDEDPAKRPHRNHRRAPHWEQKRWVVARGAPQAVQKKPAPPPPSGPERASATSRSMRAMRSPEVGNPFRWSSSRRMSTAWSSRVLRCRWYSPSDSLPREWSNSSSFIEAYSCSLRSFNANRS